jgi:hypothetical protein
MSETVNAPNGAAPAVPVSAKPAAWATPVGKPVDNVSAAKSLAAESAAGAKPADAVPPKQPAASGGSVGAPVSDKPTDPGLERRAEALARAKRESAKVLQARKELAAERASHAEALKKAAEWDRLTKIRETDDYALVKELGIDVNKLSRRFLEDSTGQGKNPAELVKTEVDRQLAEIARLKAIEDKKKSDEEAVRIQKQTYEGAKKQIADILKADTVKYELANKDAKASLAKAWEHVENFYLKHQVILGFDKALDAVETELEERQIDLLSTSEKVKAAMEKLRIAQADAAKTAAKAPKIRGVEPVAAKHVETDEAPKSLTAVPPIRRRPLDVHKMAALMVAQHKASQDN